LRKFVVKPVVKCLEALRKTLERQSLMAWPKMKLTGDPFPAIKRLGTPSKMPGSADTVSTFIRLMPLLFACVVAQASEANPTTPGPVEPAKATMPDQAEPTKPATPAATTSAASPTNPASAPAKPQQLMLVDKTLTQAEVNRLLSQGYKPQRGRGDSVLYCRLEAQLGTHFEKKVCMTASQIKTATQESRDATESLQHNLGNPSKPCPTCSS
jgi:hypothetical protein